MSTSLSFDYKGRRVKLVDIGYFSFFTIDDIKYLRNPSVKESWTLPELEKGAKELIDTDQAIVTMSRAINALEKYSDCHSEEDKLVIQELRLWIMSGREKMESTHRRHNER